MPYSTTTDADSSIPFASFKLAQREDTLHGVFCYNLRDTMPYSTTTDADSSIPFASFKLAQRQDTLLGAFCSNMRISCRNRRQVTPTRQSPFAR